MTTQPPRRKTYRVTVEYQTGLLKGETFWYDTNAYFEIGHQYLHDTQRVKVISLTNNYKRP